jgi:TPR repeat protein
MKRWAFATASFLLTCAAFGAESLDGLRERANAGDSDAQNRLGVVLYRGEGVPMDLDAATSWFQKAAAHGDKYALDNLGMTEYLSSQADAVTRWRKAADLGNPHAMCNLAWAYSNGRGVATNRELAFQLFAKAAEGGSVAAANVLGQWFSKGDEVASRNLDLALGFYAKAAFAELTDDLRYRVAVHYFDLHRKNAIKELERELRFPDRDEQETVSKWASLLAARGFPYAQYLMGRMCAKGELVAKDEIAARDWYRKAAEQDNVDAQFALALAYYAGTGVSRDYGSAAKWFRAAANQGHAEAQFNLALMYFKGEGIPKDYTEAVTWYRKAAEQGDSEAQNQLASAYREGNGVSRDSSIAVAWYRKSAERGNLNGLFNLGEMYFEGAGVPRDVVSAHLWWNLAGARGDEAAKARLLELEKQMLAEQKAEAMRLARETFERFRSGEHAIYWLR